MSIRIQLLKAIILFLPVNLLAQVYKVGEIIINENDNTKGVVFWVHPDGSGGWMVALNDASTGCAWGTENVDISELANFDNNNVLSDTAGYTNTQKIRAYQNNNTNYAAGKVDFNNGWYLPAAGQLYILGTVFPLIKSKIIAAGGTNLVEGNGYYGTGFYLSSTEESAKRAWYFFFAMISGGKNVTPFRVRAVRSFTNKKNTVVYDTTFNYQWSTGATEPYLTITPTATTTYSVTATTAAGCSATASQTILVADGNPQTIYATIREGETYTQMGFNENTTGVYTRSITQNGCTVLLTLNLTVTPARRTIVRDTVCYGEVYQKNEMDVRPYQTGELRQTFRYVLAQYDSLVTVELLVMLRYATVITDTVCQNALYNKHGFSRPEQKNAVAGHHADTLRYVSKHGCDSLIILNLLVTPTYTTVISDEINVHESYNKYGFNLPVQNTIGIQSYSRALQTTGYNCDSTVVLNLKVVCVEKDTILIDSICHTDSYYFNGRYLDTAGVYYDTILTASGCDSIITLKLRVNPTYDLTDTIIICDNLLPYVYKDTTFDIGTTSGNYIIRRKTVNGCDSIVTLTLTVNPTYNLTDSIIICDSQMPYVYRDTIFDIGTTSSVYIFSRQTVNGCDSLVTLTLTVNLTYILTDDKTICDNLLPYVYRDTIFDIGTTSGSYIFRLNSASGCDSLVTLTLTVNPTYNLTADKTICENQLPYVYRDTIFDIGTTSGVYIFSRQTVNGCDSLVTLTLTVNPTYNLTDGETICEKQLPYVYGDTIFDIGTTSGVYIFHRKSTIGCDSLVTLTLTVNSGYNFVDSQTVCENQLPYVYGDTIFDIGTTSGSYIFRLKSASGCDSVVTLNLTVANTPEIIAPESLFACYGATATISATANAATIAWYKDESYTESLAQSGSFETQAISAATYYVSARSTDGCIAYGSVKLVVSDSLYLLPPTLSPYKQSNDYTQQLETNAEQTQYLPMVGDYPLWLQLDSKGKLYGSPSRDEVNSYTFTVLLEDGYGCIAERQYTLSPDDLFFIPKAFSPNGDGVNDYFKKGYRVIIFDRLGIKLFEGNDGWDGTHNGRPMQEDIYFYIIYYTGADGRETRKTGSIGIKN